MTSTSQCCNTPNDTDTNNDSTHDVVKDYYGKVLAGSDDLQTNACCSDDGLSAQMKTVLSNIHDEVLTRYYGCGLVTPESLEGCHILDLGCGAGRDCYALAQLVGESGSVIGVDMTDEQLAVANKHIEYHQNKFGFAKPNTTFLKGYIEKLDELNIPDNSIDVVISNCVINLSPDKNAVLKEVFRILKPGGEIYFSDVYADRRVPSHLVEDPLLYGECLSGALYWNDFENLAKQVGFAEPRLVSSRVITVDNDELSAKLEDIRFTSATYRLFKADDLETNAQDYGHQVKYLGTIAEHEQDFHFDQSTHFVKGEVTSISGNLWYTLKQSRFNQSFEFVDNGSKHLGFFSAQNQRSEADFDFQIEPQQSASGCCSPAPAKKTSCC
ncbi:methyltransferase type 11 [Shewanella sp. OPT22]|nr:methyltransferase type 11 [Shewanella sp. OPT22]